MAGAWIKVEHITPDKPEIVAMAEALKIDQDAVFGKCMRVWIWADQQTISGDDLSVTPSFLDRLTNCPGFSDALIKEGWLASRSGRFWLPNFARHNGQTAKNRALSADRMKRHRYDETVTEPSPDQSKSKSKKTPLPPKGGERTRFVPPDVEEVAAYCASRKNGIDAQAWWDAYQRSGWVVGKNKTPMRDWQAAVRTWEHNRRQSAPAQAETGFSLQPDFRGVE
jgi:hypothetical protein